MLSISEPHTVSSLSSLIGSSDFDERIRNIMEDVYSDGHRTVCKCLFSLYDLFTFIYQRLWLYFLYFCVEFMCYCAFNVPIHLLSLSTVSWVATIAHFLAI